MTTGLASNDSRRPFFFQFAFQLYGGPHNGARRSCAVVQNAARSDLHFPHLPIAWPRVRSCPDRAERCMCRWRDGYLHNRRLFI